MTGANHSAGSGTSGGGGSSSTDSGSTGTDPGDTGNTGSGSTDGGSSGTESPDTGSTSPGSSGGGSSGTEGSSSTGSTGAGSSNSGSDSSSASSTTTSTETASTGLGDSGFAETSFVDSDFASEAIASLLADPITGSENSFDLETQPQTLLVASAGVSSLQNIQPNEAENEIIQNNNSGDGGTNNLFIPSTAAIDSSDEFLSAIQQDIANILSTIDSNNGVRIQLPTSSTEVLETQTLGPSDQDESTLAPETLNFDNNEEGNNPENIDSEASDLLSWQQFAPADKAGMIPLLISLNARPQGDMIVQLRASNLNAFGSADFNFTPENWNQPQLIWIDANQIEFEGESETLELKVGLLSATDPDTVDIEILNIEIQDPTPCAESKCGQAAAQAREIDGEDDPNLDLELSTIAEERSAFFLFLRSSLSPFLVLTNMALHMIRQLQPEEPTQVASLELSSAADNQRVQEQTPDSKVDNVHVFAPIDLSSMSETATPNVLRDTANQIGQLEPASLLTDNPNPFERF